MSIYARLKKQRAALTGIAAAIAFVVGGTALHYSDRVIAADEPAAAASPAPQSVEVMVMQPVEQRLWHEFSGRLQAVDRVEIKPRVSGTISDVLFDEGSEVKKGDLLFVIDKRPYQAALDVAKAALQEAEAEVGHAQSELTRAKRLVAKKSVSKSHYDSVKSTHKIALAKVAAANAELTQAELNFEYAHIRAPIDGRIDRAELTVGNVVESGPGAPVLTSIVSTAQLYASFDVDEQTYLDSVRQQRDGRLPVELRLAGDGDRVYHGAIHAFANHMDTTSGTIRARAILDNRDGALLPGMFANIRLGSAAPESLMLVEEKAVGTNQDQKYVYVVSDDNEITYREVSLGRSIDGKRVVLVGLKAGDQVLINSLQRVQPGSKVEPVDVADKNAVSRAIAG